MPSERKPNRRNANDEPLDGVNRRLLLELQTDARLSLAELGRRVGLSAPAVGERLQRLQEAGVVRGYRAEAVEVPGARFVDNAEFATTGEAHSLALAETALGADTLVAFGDIVLKRYIVQALLEEAGEGITLSVDSALAGREVPDRVRGSRPTTVAARRTSRGASVTVA